MQPQEFPKMPYPKTPPPGWGEDALSNFLNSSITNIFASFERPKMRYSLLSQINQLFFSSIQLSNNSKDYVPAFFLLQAHSSFTSCALLSLSAQIIEAYRSMRGCLENALYAIHISKNIPAAQVWTDRNRDKQSK